MLPMDFLNNVSKIQRLWTSNFKHIEASLHTEIQYYWGKSHLVSGLTPDYIIAVSDT